MKKFIALYLFINSTRAPGSAGIQAEALANWCTENGVANYRYFADHETQTTIKGEEMNVRAALNRLMGKVKKQKVSQVVCFEMDQIGGSMLERRLVLETCKNHSTPMIALTRDEVNCSGESVFPASEDQAAQAEGFAGADENEIILKGESADYSDAGPQAVTESSEGSAQLVAPAGPLNKAKKRGRKMTRNVRLINQLLDDGQSLSKIARAAGCSRATVQLQKKLWIALKAVSDVTTEPPLKVPNSNPQSLPNFSGLTYA